MIMRNEYVFLFFISIAIMSNQHQSPDDNSILSNDSSEELVNPRMQSPISPKKSTRKCTNCGAVGHYKKICTGNDAEICENIKRQLNVTHERAICTPCLVVGDLLTKMNPCPTLKDSSATKHIRVCNTCKRYGHYEKTCKKLESC